MMTIRSSLFVLFVIAGLVLMSNGLYIKAKAQVADWMITNSWEAHQNSGVPQKPWPWADTWVVAQIEVPRLGIKQYVMQDASGESLAFGAGAVIPVSANGYNFFAGHRDTHFSFLDELTVGDKVIVETYQGNKLVYHVSNTQVIDTRKGDLSVDEHLEGISLMTCWPMESLIPGGPLRYVVSGVEA
jgi:sortase A